MPRSGAAGATVGQPSTDIISHVARGYPICAGENSSESASLSGPLASRSAPKSYRNDWTTFDRPRRRQHTSRPTTQASTQAGGALLQRWCSRDRNLGRSTRRVRWSIRRRTSGAKPRAAGLDESEVVSFYSTVMQNSTDDLPSKYHHVRLSHPPTQLEGQATGLTKC